MRDGSTSPRGKRVGKIVGTVRQLTRVRGDRGAARGRPSVTGHAQTSKIGCPERDSASLAGMALDAQRVWNRCDELARFSERTDALTRIFLSKEMRQADDLVGTWMREAGMVTRQDEAGNCIGRYEGVTPGMPCLMLGSHLDTVRDAGKYDGMLGVLSAIECVALLDSSQQRLPFAIEVVGFSDEEGVRFGSTLLGSRAVAGRFDQAVLAYEDAEGVRMDDAIRSFGLDPARICEAALDENVIGFVEIHIEQGPVLEAENLPLAVVEGITGQTRLGLRFTGQANHAGTTPMHIRRDALAAAAEWITTVEATARNTEGLVATVGKVAIEPNAGNVIPGVVSLSLDVRHMSSRTRNHWVKELIRDARIIAQRRGIELEWVEKMNERRVDMDPFLSLRLKLAIEAAGFPVKTMPSGAGHDAMCVAAVAPAAMIFVPSAGGRSHVGDEHTAPADLDLGAHALTASIVAIDRLLAKESA